MRPALLFFALALPGCYHSHSTRNAPGRVDVLERPASPADDPGRIPADPGEQSLAVSAGPSGGATLTSKSGDPATIGSFGAEFSLHYGQVDHSHSHDSAESARGLGPGWLDWYAGLNVGALRVLRDDRSRFRFYTEAQYSPFHGILGVSGGLLVDSDGGKGPQFTLNLGPLYARASTRLGDGTDFEMGAIFKIPIHFWVSSR